MSFLDRWKANHDIDLRRSAFILTEQGKEKLQDFSGDPKHQILMALETRGTCDVSEIAQATGLSRGHIERLLPLLLGRGYIMQSGSGYSGGES